MGRTDGTGGAWTIVVTSLFHRRTAAALPGVLALLLHTAPALAQLTTGAVEGVASDEGSGRPLAGVTVAVSGPALPGELTAVTDSRGHYVVTQLPPGDDYVVRFYYSRAVVERPGISLAANRTLSVSARLPAAETRPQEIRIVERSPTIDVASANNAVTVGADLVRNTPVRGRTYDAVLLLAPGSFTDNVGLSLGGGSGPENGFLVDGVNVTNPAYGLMGTQLSLELIKETEILLGGYGAEYGRSMGGLVNVVTRSGSNELHGGVWLGWAPFSLNPRESARLGEAISTVRRGGTGASALDSFDHALDFGFQLGGPVVKDRVWFQIGFAPTFYTQRYDRSIRTRIATTAEDAARGGASDPSVTCPAWLMTQDAALCEPSTTAAARTVPTGERFDRRFESESRLYNYLLKFNVRISDDHRLSLTYVGSPSTFRGVFNNPRNPLSAPIGFNAAPGILPFTDDLQVHDLAIRYLAWLAGRALQLDVLAGLHYEHSRLLPSETGAAAGSAIDLRTAPLSRYEEVPPCAPTLVGNVPFNPCPVSGYQYSGFGPQFELTNQRISIGAGLTWFLRLAGAHAIKLGGDVEELRYRNHQAFSGGANGGRFFIRGNGGVQRRQYGTSPDDQTVQLLGNDDPAINGYTAQTRTLNYALYLRDSWNVGFLPGFTLNAGVRWEAQELKDPAGQTRIGIYDNVAPRIGFAYDFTGRGRARLHASYGRFYESLPADLNDRQFGGAGLVVQSLAPAAAAAACPVDANGRASGLIDVSGCRFPAPVRQQLFGGTPGVVAPGLKGQYSNEVTAGLQYDVGWDLVLGAAYIHRDLGRVIDDLLPDAQHFVVANPGDPSATGGAADYPKPTRDYNALQLTASRRFTDHLLLLASYTYSRTVGNYPGLYSPNPGQLDPNTSIQYDLRQLLVNGTGPLPQDRPHNLKVTGAGEIPIGAAGAIAIGVNFFALSGTPIDVLGFHPAYGPRQAYILPRGTGGRTPTVTQLDLHVGWSRALGRGVRADVTADVFNVFNQREVTQVEQQYTADDVRPIPNGDYRDLAVLKTGTGGAPHLDPSFGQPTAFQAPLSLRLGARLSF